jgi:hypothetical protein
MGFSDTHPHDNLPEADNADYLDRSRTVYRRMDPASSDYKASDCNNLISHRNSYNFADPAYNLHGLVVVVDVVQKAAIEAPDESDNHETRFAHDCVRPDVATAVRQNPVSLARSYIWHTSHEREEPRV